MTDESWKLAFPYMMSSKGFRIATPRIPQPVWSIYVASSDE